MKYLVTSFKIEAADEVQRAIARQLLADALGNHGYESFMDTDDGMEAYIQDTLFTPQAPDEAVDETPLQGVTFSHSTEAIPDQDWNAAWEAEGFDPIEVAGTLTIYDARRTYSADDFHTPLTIGIQARNAFGTGTHPTTRMVLGRLMQLPLDGRRVLDCGTGTGILSILALMRGAGQAVGYDIDEWSVENARHNALLNGQAEGFTSLMGDGTVIDSLEGKFDVVAANINRNIILGDLPRIARKLADGGHVIMSGFYEQDAAAILELARQFDLAEVGREVTDDWCCLVLKK